MNKFSYLKDENLEYIEEMQRRFEQDPDSVDPSWRFFFEGMEVVLSSGALRKVETVRPRTLAPETGPINAEASVSALINGYRELGVHIARINPLAEPLETHPLLELSSLGLSDDDLDRPFMAAKLIGFSEAKPLREIIAALRETYCSTVGVEFAHIEDPFPREWIRTRLESNRSRTGLDRDSKRRILRRLTETETFERFLHTRYVAQKRFSLEGGDTLVPMLDSLIERTSEFGARDVIIGMAHRGRLNVLANVFGKKLEFILSEFEGASDTGGGEGDVKYHLGWASRTTTPEGKEVALELAFNPSHLEFVDPVVEGITFARQKATGFGSFEAQAAVVPVLIHGEAAFCGQGVVYETMQLSALRGFGTGGTIHIVVNNQVGFTADPNETRSTSFATDLGKMLQTPILHVNGDDPEAATFVMQVASEFRQLFHRDIVIDLVCYRKYGHNEGDEPAFTQPLMVQKIKAHPSVREIYAKKLGGEGVVTDSEAAKWIEEVISKMAAAQVDARANLKAPRAFAFEGMWKGLRRATNSDLFAPVKTSVDAGVLRGIAKNAFAAPNGFHVHPKLVRLLSQRVKTVSDGEGIDWGTGELLAYGSLLVEGIPVRLSGQDSERGTFSHRHSVLRDIETGERFVGLNQLKEGQAEFTVLNSLLSETAVLGFEWGMSITDPRRLVIWEAQFGDFVNGAQVVIDQFIAASESKWQRMSGLVLLLPHGSEGQGAEHSSARPERFLQLCASKNMQVMNLTTPAQLFHALRRQMHRDFRKPLIVLSPKSLLRHPSAVSKIADFSEGGFSEVIDDVTVLKNARRVILCTGKIYYDLDSRRRESGIRDVALVRVEQLYPWPQFGVRQLLKNYAGTKEIVWVQEEPRNQGYWQSVEYHLKDDLMQDQKLSVIARPASPTPAVGSHKVHDRQQNSILEEALK